MDVFFYILPFTKVFGGLEPFFKKAESEKMTRVSFSMSFRPPEPDCVEPKGEDRVPVPRWTQAGCGAAALQRVRGGSPAKGVGRCPAKGALI